MKRLLCVLSAALMLMSAQTDSYAQMSDNMLSDADKEAGWKLLFDGRSLLGWNPRGGGAEWSVEDGTITAVAVRGPSYIGSTQEFADFTLKADFWTDEGHNSGIFVRGPANPGARVGQFSFYEINIADTHRSGFTTGSIVDKKVFEPAPTTAGKWNTIEIVANGRDLSVTLNGEKGLEIKDSTHYSGVIALQVFGEGRVRFKNIKIMEIK
ncbi:MAG: DUF1080 domain-containing protein [Candidatus Latescibacteria bacterium]|nr:DUF1080 domain-containing protein [Candidatus Latescibacterota bacterium]